MLTTTNYGLYKPEGTDIVNVQNFNDNADKIDTALRELNEMSYPTVEATGTNTYVGTNSKIKSLSKGIKLTLFVATASTGSCTLNLNSLGAKSIKDSNGTVVTNLKANIPYNLCYNGTDFILQGKGGGGTATADKILSGYKATVDTGQVTGTMPNQSGQTLTIGTLRDDNGNIGDNIVSIIDNSATGSDTAMTVSMIPYKGYYDGETTKLNLRFWGITPNRVKAGQRIGYPNNTVTGTFTSDANATASQILSGYSGYVNGNKVNGGMVNRGAVSATLNAGGSYTIPAGYHNGSGKISANSLASQGAIKMQSGTSISYTEPRSESSSYYNVYIDINPSFTPKAVLVYFPTSMSNSVYTPIVLIGTNLFGTALYQYYDQTSSTLSKHELRSTTGGSLTKYLISCDNSATAYAGKSVSWIALG